MYAFVVPTVFAVFASAKRWFYDLQPWLDFSNTSSQLYDGPPSAVLWAQIVVSGAIWLLLPMAIGLTTLRRAEVK